MLDCRLSLSWGALPCWNPSWMRSRHSRRRRPPSNHCLGTSAGLHSTLANQQNWLPSLATNQTANFQVTKPNDPLLAQVSRPPEGRPETILWFPDICSQKICRKKFKDMEGVDGVVASILRTASQFFGARYVVLILTKMKIMKSECAWSQSIRIRMWLVYWVYWIRKCEKCLLCWCPLNEEMLMLQRRPSPNLQKQRQIWSGSLGRARLQHFITRIMRLKHY